MHSVSPVTPRRPAFELSLSSSRGQEGESASRVPEILQELLDSEQTYFQRLELLMHVRWRSGCTMQRITLYDTDGGLGVL